VTTHVGFVPIATCAAPSFSKYVTRVFFPHLIRDAGPRQPDDTRALPIIWNPFGLPLSCVPRVTDTVVRRWHSAFVHWEATMRKIYVSGLILFCAAAFVWSQASEVTNQFTLDESISMESQFNGHAMHDCGFSEYLLNTER
jgi:hypothetical protein